jgi:hypothetical protein
MKLPATFLILVATIHCVFAAAATRYEDELIYTADVIAIIDVHEVDYGKLNWERQRVWKGKEFESCLVLYRATVVQTLKGSIPTRPWLAQWEDDGDLSDFKEGRYLAFLHESNGMYFPIVTGFEIAKESVDWYAKPFRHGDYGPYVARVPLSKAISDIREMLNERKAKCLQEACFRWKRPIFSSQDAFGQMDRDLPYFGENPIKPVRVDRRDSWGTLIETKIYFSDFLAVLSANGDILERRPYAPMDFFTGWGWEHQQSLEHPEAHQPSSTPR